VSEEARAAERLALADWRRRVADLYASVRIESASDPAAAWDHWRATREELFRNHPQSPVPAAERAAFTARHWPYDPSLRFEVAVLADEPPRTSPEKPFGAGLTLALPISTDGEEAFTRIGRVDVPFQAGRRGLGLYWMAGYAGGLFLPFRDATNGHETYAAGRYLLDTAKSADLGAGATGSLILDFNFVFHPSCAWDPKWSCPLAPPENLLDIRVEAGERLS
jgi:uncharacterized protein